MADVKWIKITTDIFDDEKILLIESLPEADSIIVIWFKLLCLAGKINNSGVFMLNDKVAYTDKMLASIFRRKESTVKLALETFETFGMIEIVDDVITIPNWGKHQSLDAIESKRNYQRKYMREYREKQKKLIGTTKYNENGLSSSEWKNILEEFDYKCAYCGKSIDVEQDHLIPVNKGGAYIIGNIVPACRHCNASKGPKNVFDWYKEQEFYDEERCKHLRKYLRKTNVRRIEEDIDIDKDIYIDISKDISSKNECEKIVKLFNSICKSFSKVQKLSDKRIKTLRTRLKTYSVDDFETVFRKAEESDFLSGRNGSWNGCGFDWLINETNMIKVLEGNYDNKGKSKQSDPSSKIWGELIFLDEENRYELPYLGFPKVWFDGDKLIKERVQPVIRPRYTSKGWYEDIEIDVKELLEEYEARGRIANGETTDDLDFGSGGK